MRIILPAHVGLIMRMQACSCVHLILPKNSNPSFSNFFSYFTCNAFVLDPFIYIYMKFSVCLFVCLSHVKLGFILYFLILMP